MDHGRTYCGVRGSKRGTETGEEFTCTRRHKTKGEEEDIRVYLYVESGFREKPRVLSMLSKDGSNSRMYVVCVEFSF